MNHFLEPQSPPVFKWMEMVISHPFLMYVMIWFIIQFIANQLKTELAVSSSRLRSSPGIPSSCRGLTPRTHLFSTTIVYRTTWGGWIPGWIPGSWRGIMAQTRGEEAVGFLKQVYESLILLFVVLVI